MTTKTRKVANIGNDIIETLGTGPISGFRNAIINGNFDIWQRGTSLGSGSGVRYIADRWRPTTNISTCTASQQAFTLGQTAVPGEPTYFHRMVVSSVANVASYAILVQPIENVKTFAGQNVTISFWAKSDASRPIAVELAQLFGSGGSTEVDTFVAKPTLTTSWVKYVYTVAVPAITGATIGANDFLGMHFWFDGGSNWNSRTGTLGQQSGTFDIAQVQVEAGTLATPFEKRHIGTELSLCQRYYEKSYDFGINPGTALAYGGILCMYIDGQTLGAHTGLIYFNFATEKRTVPTMTFYSLSSGASGYVHDYSQLPSGADISVTAHNIGTHGGRVWASQTASSYGVNQQYHFAADAEL